MKQFRICTKLLCPGYSQLSQCRTEFITYVMLCNAHVESVCGEGGVELVDHKSGPRGGPLENKSDSPRKFNQ